MGLFDRIKQEASKLNVDKLIQDAENLKFDTIKETAASIANSNEVKELQRNIKELSNNQTVVTATAVTKQISSAAYNTLKSEAGQDLVVECLDSVPGVKLIHSSVKAGRVFVDNYKKQDKASISEMACGEYKQQELAQANAEVDSNKLEQQNSESLERK